jgi:orotidine-5'-phosphate decarboxylase
MSKNPICFALDFPTLGAAADFLRKDDLHAHIGAVKVGLELFISSGPRSMEILHDEYGKDVVLDLKLHDIPETVGRAVTAGGNLGAKYMTLHVQQKAAIEAAARAAEPFGITLLGVTVLTSMASEDMSNLGMEKNLAGVSSVMFRAMKLVQFAHGCGLRGFVCSPVEVKALKELAPDSFFLVPGVRPAGSDAGGQKRLGTPGQAVKDGASLIVVGRPIRDAKDPVRAAKDILAETVASA